MKNGEHSRLQLPARLGRYNAGGVLIRAVETASKALGVAGYNRTTIARWLAGDSTPRSEEFMHALGKALGDETIVAAWREDVAGGVTPVVRGILTRFRALPWEQQMAAFARIAEEMGRHHPLRREQFEIQMEISQIAGSRDARLHVIAAWTGGLPERACVQVASNEGQLSEAYSLESCIFRELVPAQEGDSDEKPRCISETQVLFRYKAKGEKEYTQAPRLQDLPQSRGLYLFDTPGLKSARISLELMAHYPCEHRVYPLMLGRYSILGPARVRIRVNLPDVSQIHSLQFLGELDTAVVRSSCSNEMLMEIGAEDAVLSPHYGVVFYWSP